MFDAEINSGFTKGGDINISNRFTEITLLHRSANGYTEVYKAKRLGQWHTLKCLTKDVAEDVQYQTLLEKEFRIAFPLTHPNIIRTLGIESVPELGNCIIQEYIDSLPCDIITREQAIDLCEAVAYLHQSGIVHRDIKPENILIRKDNKHAILIDFGLADKADFSVLKGGAGTTGYAAPEQWSGELSPLIDIYGIGGVLLSNKHLKRIASKCRQTNPTKRYQSASAVKKALTRHFPWFTVSLFVAFILLALWGGYSLRSIQENNSVQQHELQHLQQENSRLSGEVESMHSTNAQLKADLNSLENNYRNYKQSAEEKQRELEKIIELEHNHNARLQHEINPFGFSPSRNPGSVADQLY